MYILFSRGYTDFVPQGWKGRAVLMVIILFSIIFLSSVIGFVSSRITAYSSSQARRIKKVQSHKDHVVIDLREKNENLRMVYEALIEEIKN